MSEIKSWFVIVNPTSGGGAGKRKWPRIKTSLRANGFQFEYEITQSSGHGIELINKAAKRGFSKYICVGGDGTLHEVINALMAQNQIERNQISVGLIPIGTGNDWARQYDIPKQIDLAVQRIRSGRPVRQDIGEIQFLSDPQKSIFFNNLCGIGFDGHVVKKVHKYKYLGAMAYLLGAIVGILTHKNFPIHLSWEDQNMKATVLMAVFGIGKFSGGGMQLTENPDPHDGYIDMSVAGNLSSGQVIGLIPSLFNGRITDSKWVTTAKVKTVQIEVPDGYSPLIEADGELVGQGSFRVSIISKAIRFYV
ncbi:MAG: diacylglycerol kinase family lipid kinase [Flavobacteriaceae bacterium]|nr:diacylglycerol kinase family lipid kinase [Flavobacteriaceae bacterium]